MSIIRCRIDWSLWLIYNGVCEVPRSLFYGDKISLPPAGTATLVYNLDSKCRILWKHVIDGKSFNKPGESASNSLESPWEEYDQIDCSNAMHDSSSQDNISEFESDNASTENYARMHFGHRDLCQYMPHETKARWNQTSFELSVQITHSWLMRNVSGWKHRGQYFAHGGL